MRLGPYHRPETHVLRESWSIRVRAYKTPRPAARDRRSVDQEYRTCGTAFQVPWTTPDYSVPALQSCGLMHRLLRDLFQRKTSLRSSLRRDHLDATRCS